MTDTTALEDFISAQSEMKNAELNKTNPHFKSRYADLTAVRAATLPALNKFGIGIQQSTTMTGESFMLVTKVVHKSGEVLDESSFPITLGPPQKMGSEITYARRYAWATMCGISADDDDDGNAASRNQEKKDITANWKGPLNRTALKESITALANTLREISAKDTLEHLEGLWADYKDVLEQVEIDMPKWSEAVKLEKRKAEKVIDSFPGDTAEGDPFSNEVAA
tara:strand:+ start:1741 stop:2412 length:672 start_codon:yes stop_codon:yes gene_type:complete